jgi:competence protein ComEA
VTDLLERYRWFIVGVLALPLAVGIGFLLADRLGSPDALQLDLPPEEIRVYVTGAVQRPGVYPLDDGDRWIDALDAAGGPAVDADLAAVDLARRARDEDTVLVPRLGQTAVSGVSQGPLIDINVASAAELETLPGIGEVRAGAIVRSRQEDGAFASVDEMLERELLPSSVFEEIADLVTAGAPAGGAGP